MASERFRFLKNAVSNVISGASSAVFAVVLPYFFVRYFSRAEFGLWVLVLQLAAYVNFLNFGFQVAIGRYVAHSLERNDRPHAEQILATGLQILSALALIGLVIIALLALTFSHAFKGVDPQLIPTGQAAILWTGSAIALGLPFSAFLGVFIGLQRNDIPAAIAAGGRTVLALAIIAAAAFTRSLTNVAEVYFAGTMLQYVVQYLAFLYICRGWRVPVRSWSAETARELIDYCASLSVWSLAMLLITGAGTTIVGVFDFGEVAAFAVAASLVGFLAGIMQALMAPLIQIFAKQHARHQIASIVATLSNASFVSTSLLFATAAWLIALAPPAFNTWVGPSIAAHAVPLFDVLVVAIAIRNSATSFTNYLIATGQQRKVMITPVIEGVTNVVVSIVGAQYLGAMGVALGTLAGSLAGIAASSYHNFPRTLPTSRISRDLVMSNLLKPALSVVPLVIAVALLLIFHPPLVAEAGLMLTGTALTGALAYRERGQLRLRTA